MPYRKNNDVKDESIKNIAKKGCEYKTVRFDWEFEYNTWDWTDSSKTAA